MTANASRLQTSCYKTSRYQQSIDNTQATIQTLSFKTHIPPPPTHLWISNTTYHSIIPRPIYVSCLHLNHFTVPYSLPSLPCHLSPPSLVSHPSPIAHFTSVAVQIHPFLQQSMNAALPGSRHLSPSRHRQISNRRSANHIALTHNTAESSLSSHPGPARIQIAAPPITLPSHTTLQRPANPSQAGRRTHSLAVPAITSPLPATTYPFTLSVTCLPHLTTIL